RSPTAIPSTVIEPVSNRSSPLMHLTSVLLPEPEGPQTTTTSPRATRVEQSCSTCVDPYDLPTPSSTRIAPPAVTWVIGTPAGRRAPPAAIRPGRSQDTQPQRNNTSPPAGHPARPPRWPPSGSRATKRRKPARCPGTG